MTEESQRLSRELLKRTEDLIDAAYMALRYAEDNRARAEFMNARRQWLEDFRRWEIMELIR